MKYAFDQNILNLLTVWSRKKVYTSSSENVTNHKSYFYTYVMSVIK